MKDIIGKSKQKRFFFISNKIAIDKEEEEEILKQKAIAQKFNDFFENIRSKLAKKNQNPKTPFESYIKYNGSNFRGYEFTDKELEKALDNLKLNESPRWDSISSTVVKGFCQDHDICSYLFLNTFQSLIKSEHLS